MREYPIGNPYNHSVEVNHSQRCDYCHKNPIKFMVAGKQGNRYDLICQQCYNISNQIVKDRPWRLPIKKNTTEDQK
jgi:hypothetical protein